MVLHRHQASQCLVHRRLGFRLQRALRRHRRRQLRPHSVSNLRNLPRNLHSASSRQSQHRLLRRRWRQPSVSNRRSQLRRPRRHRHPHLVSSRQNRPRRPRRCQLPPSVSSHQSQLRLLRRHRHPRLVSNRQNRPQRLRRLRRLRLHSNLRNQWRRLRRHQRLRLHSSLPLHRLSRRLVLLQLQRSVSSPRKRSRQLLRRSQARRWRRLQLRRRPP